MIDIIPSEKRHFGDHGWLQARWHFSFSDYHDPKNMNWGPLRVFNDDVVQPGGGFPMHPHRDMEIITYVIEGELKHKDHMGHVGRIGPGDVQVMSAGKGVMHSESNPSKVNATRLLQMWVMPREGGAQPKYADRKYDRSDRLNRLFLIVSSGDVPGTLTIGQDARFYVSALEKTQEVTTTLSTGRLGYLFVITGEVTLNAQALHDGDQARVVNETELKITATRDSELIFIDLPPA